MAETNVVSKITGYNEGQYESQNAKQQISGMNIISSNLPTELSGENRTNSDIYEINIDDFVTDDDGFVEDPMADVKGYKNGKVITGYDEQGRVTGYQFVQITPDGNRIICSYTEIKYDDINGGRVEKHYDYLSGDGSTKSCRYDKDGDLTAEKEVYKNGSYYYAEYYKNGDLKYQKNYNPNRGGINPFVKEYNPDGTSTETIWLRNGNVLIRKYKTDQFGDRILTEEKTVPESEVKDINQM